MIISDLSYLETAEGINIEGSSNYAYVSQYASATAGNNYGGHNASIGNTAVAVNTSNIQQYSFKKYFYLGH